MNKLPRNKIVTSRLESPVSSPTRSSVLNRRKFKRDSYAIEENIVVEELECTSPEEL